MLMLALGRVASFRRATQFTGAAFGRLAAVDAPRREDRVRPQGGLGGARRRRGAVDGGGSGGDGGQAKSKATALFEGHENEDGGE